jgi:holo-[acyl-carrier protein] synthase
VIVSIGIDIVEVSRVRAAIKRTPRFLERVFTQTERDYCDARGASSFMHYAARFAAKEAAMKALGTGWAEGISWHDAEITRTERGAPILKLHGRAHEIFLELGAARTHLSLSHTSEHAIAQVILEAAGAPHTPAQL